MKKYSFIVMLLISFNLLFAQNNDPIIKKTASKIEDFIPTDWKLIVEEKGDLNKDLLADEVLIIEEINPKNLIADQFLGSPTLNITPRILMVLFKQANGKYLLAVKNSGFVPSENDDESPCLADPIGETGGVEIKKGVLIVSYQYWLSCGSYGVNANSYTFRYQDKKFALIGLDEHYYSRASGEITKMSINFSTNSMNYTEGGNMFKEEENKPKTKFKKIPAKKLLDLATITTDEVDGFALVN
ncbi:hypothetical protein [Pedobacter cryotolerans]|uniref:Uncharacterized protein n=1 Tax=Pedobacter cryotolerans TaxID=2571270 RepID=A0A4U1CCS6_9SPHI|nr:hypothetical protein [Pedobacter cryotolerans]TKC01754.1 hypothetical protein FA045_05740 [Pedobacter cryotolerans]